jgi:hypothetical protein
MASTPSPRVPTHSLIGDAAAGQRRFRPFAKGGLPLANSRPIADLRLGEQIVSDVSEATIGERNSIRAVIAVCCAWS